jgi:hypothetical protein
MAEKSFHCSISLLGFIAPIGTSGDSPTSGPVVPTQYFRLIFFSENFGRVLSLRPEILGHGSGSIGVTFGQVFFRRTVSGTRIKGLTHARNPPGNHAPPDEME